jgi:predicted RNA binding protein YcfA (HicA-like mRNA interferase family)
VKDEKLIRKFLSDDKHITMDECGKLLVNNGYVLHKSGGSHRVYHKKGFISITVVAPKGAKYVKSPYVKQLIKDLNLEG